MAFIVCACKLDITNIVELQTILPNILWRKTALFRQQDKINVCYDINAAYYNKFMKLKVSCCILKLLFNRIFFSFFASREKKSETLNFVLKSKLHNTFFFNLIVNIHEILIAEKKSETLNFILKSKLCNTFCNLIVLVHENLLIFIFSD